MVRCVRASSNQKPDPTPNPPTHPAQPHVTPPRTMLASVIDADKQDVAFQYGPTDDATESKDTTGGDWAEALTRME